MCRDGRQSSAEHAGRRLGKAVSAYRVVASLYAASADVMCATGAFRCPSLSMSDTPERERERERERFMSEVSDPQELAHESEKGSVNVLRCGSGSLVLQTMIKESSCSPGVALLWVVELRCASHTYHIIYQSPSSQPPPSSSSS